MPTSYEDINKSLSGMKDTVLGMQRGLSQFQNQTVGNTEPDYTKKLTEALPAFDENAIKNTVGETKTLLEKYNDLQKQRLESEAATATEETKLANQRELTSSLESTRGFGTNIAAVREIEDTGRKRLAAIEKAKNEALLANDAETVSKLANLGLQEQTLITQGRQQFFSNLLGLAGFESPQQKRTRELQSSLQTSILNLSASAPDAGILPTDDLQTALNKYKNSSVYTQNTTKGELELNKLRAEIAKTNAEAAKALKTAGTFGDLSPGQQTAAFKLSDDYEKASQNYYDILGSYNRVLASTQNPSPAGDISLIFNFMKMLDPRSTVREGEYATAANAGSVPQTIQARYNRLVNGERLSESIRNDFVTQTKALFESAQQQQDLVNEQFRTRATQYGVPIDLILRPGVVTSKSSSTPSLATQPALQQAVTQNDFLQNNLFGSALNDILNDILKK